MKKVLKILRAVADRLREPSTRGGFAFIFGLFGVVLPENAPELASQGAEAAIQVIEGVSALISFGFAVSMLWPDRSAGLEKKVDAQEKKVAEVIRELQVAKD